MADSGGAVANPPDAPDPHVLLDALRLWRAERFDPVGFRFIEALARRASARGGEARHALHRRLAEALAEYGERFDRAEREAREALARGTAQFPEAADELTRHYDAGDFGGLHRLLARLDARGGSGPLAGLLDHIARHTPEGEAVVAQPGELKSLSYFRSTWSKLSVGRQLSHTFAQAPENAGPLNSHFLVLQALGLMRDTAPAYLEQFMSYADALLWLDQADSGRSPAPKNTARGERSKKRKPGRGRAA